MQSFNITSTPRPDGAHWASLRDASDALAYTLDHWSLALQAARGELSPGDLDLAAHEMTLDDGGSFDVFEDFNAYALELNVARWSEERGEPLQGETPGELAKVVIVTGTGGPHVEVVVDYNTHGTPERITETTYWSGEWSATTTDARALAIADDYLAAILPE